MDWVSYIPCDIEYSVEAVADQIAVRLDGGKTSVQETGKTTAGRVRLTWKVPYDEFTLLVNELTTGVPVLIEIQLFPSIASQTTDCVCWVVPNTLNLDSFRGQTVTVSVEVFAMPASFLRQALT